MLSAWQAKHQDRENERKSDAIVAEYIALLLTEKCGYRGYANIKPVKTRDYHAVLNEYSRQEGIFLALNDLPRAIKEITGETLFQAAQTTARKPTAYTPEELLIINIRPAKETHHLLEENDPDRYERAKMQAEQKYGAPDLGIA